MTPSAASPDDPERTAVGSSGTRRSLIDLAAELFAERGYAQTSIRDVARRGDLTTGAIYGHFRNKADLLVEAISLRTAEELEAQALDVGDNPDYVATMTRLARDYPKRRSMRALIVQGAAAAQTDEETYTKLRDEQLAYINGWMTALEASRDAIGIDANVDIPSMLLYTWAVEVGLGVLEAIGIEPPSTMAWADIQNRMARGLQLPAADNPSKRRRQRPSQA